MTDKIKHLGIVESINGSYLKVRIVQTSACSACSIKGHCSAAESKEKLIDVYNKSGLAPLALWHNFFSLFGQK